MYIYFYAIFSMVACVRLKLDLGGGVKLNDSLRNRGGSKLKCNGLLYRGGAKLKRYVSLHMGEGVQNCLKLALRNFWTAPYLMHYVYNSFFLLQKC